MPLSIRSVNIRSPNAATRKRHEGSPEMNTGEHILCMEECLARVRVAWYAPDGNVACLDHIRKVTALGVACMELHGAPRRV